MLIKKYLSLILSLALAVSLAACGGKEEPIPAESTTSGASSVVSEITPEPSDPAPSASSIVQPEEPPEEPDTLSLIMVGDVLLHTPIQESGKQEDGTYRYDHLFTHTYHAIGAADLALVNQEVILGGRDLGLTGYPAFNGAFEVGDALVNAGFDVVLHATNHALDKGEKGVRNCLGFWRENYPDIAVLGIHDDQEGYDNNVWYYEQNGIKVAVLNYTYGTNGIELPHPYTVDLLKEQKVRSDIEKAEANADFTIVCPHWGIEYTHKPADEEQRWAKLFLESGVDLVIGTHPHVIQPVEWMEDESGHKMLVYYSLGNYVNFTSDSGSGTAKRAVGAMAEVTLKREDSGVTIGEYGVTPLIAHMVKGQGKPTVYAIDDYTEELAKENEMSQKDSAFSLSWCQELCKEVFGDLYVPGGSSAEEEYDPLNDPQ